MSDVAPPPSGARQPSPPQRPRPPAPGARPSGPRPPKSDGPFSDPRVTRVVVGTVVVVALIVAGALIFLGGGDEEKGGDTATGASSTLPGGEVVTSTSGPATTTTLVQVTGAPDTFDREVADGLGSGPSPYSWTVNSGAWTVQGGAAMATSAPEEGYALATVDLGTPNGIVQATVLDRALGAGLVFRYQDPQNYWVYEFNSGFFGNLVLGKVQDGTWTKVKDDGMVFRKEDTSFGVKAEGPSITFFSDGVPVYQMNDTYLAEATGFGLAAHGDAVGTTKFDYVVVQPVGNAAG